MICFICIIFFSSRRRHTRFDCDWSSDVCSSDLEGQGAHRRVPRRTAARRQAARPHSVPRRPAGCRQDRSEEHTSELQSQSNLVCRLLLEKKKNRTFNASFICPVL